MLCPNCKGEMHCPCLSCTTKNSDKVVWKWISGNGPIECGHCGHTMSVGAWENESYIQYIQDLKNEAYNGMDKC